THEERQNLDNAGRNATFITSNAGNTPSIQSESVQLIITSPPFLNIVQYKTDNWLRCWFNSLDAEAISRGISVTGNLDKWTVKMKIVFKELFRITKPGGWVAFEVGEVRKGKIKLDEIIVPIGVENGFNCVAIIINAQKFTKTSNIWGISNNSRGTNTNRIVLFQKLKNRGIPKSSR
ncbi:MAG: site-specific DNA-methyltransferase, partial [Promethearchaeota archaeon]